MSCCGSTPAGKSRRPLMTSWCRSKTRDLTRCSTHRRPSLHLWSRTRTCLMERRIRTGITRSRFWTGPTVISTRSCKRTTARSARTTPNTASRPSWERAPPTSTPASTTSFASIQSSLLCKGNKSTSLSPIRTHEAFEVVVGQEKS